MTEARRFPLSSTPLLLLALATVALGAARPLPAQAQALGPAEEAGVWDLAFEKGNRRCRLNLRAEAAPGGYAIAMPAGCRHAFPLLTRVTSWTSLGGDRIVLQGVGGVVLMNFSPKGGRSLEATVGEDGDPYTLTPTDPSVQDNLVSVAAAEATPPPAPLVAAPVEPLPPAVRAPGGGVMVDGASAQALATIVAPPLNLPMPTVSQVAGNYAVLRDTRDTGCMVTLQDPGTRTELKARLAPACRDQGIVIFDPVGWQLAKNELILTAKKGHKTALTQRQDRTWAGNPVKGAALVLKRL